MNMKQIILIIQLQLIVILWLACDNSTGPGDTSPSLSNLVIPQNLALTCYNYPNRFVTSRNDSIIVSFDYNGKKISSIILDGSIDSGKSWFQISKIDAGTKNHADYIWSPDSSITSLKFCGEKKCVLRVSTSLDTLKSSEFVIIGSLPAALIRPAAGDHYSLSDSIPVEFISNNDLISNLDVSFFGSDIEKKVQFSKDNASVTKTDGTNTNIKHFTYLFPLLQYSAQLSEMGPTISIMISDYQLSGFYQIVKNITIDTP
jgi:hypothetical protein